MKQLKSGIVCLLTFTICAVASAQRIVTPVSSATLKPKLFKDVPGRLPVTVSQFSPLLNLKNGQAATINLSEKFAFKGTVVSSVSKYNDAIQSTVIKLADYPGATLTVSKIKNPDGTAVYRGRIVSFEHGDCFELKNEDGQYVLIKRNFEDMVND